MSLSVSAVAVFSAVAALLYFITNRHRHPLPPGPPRDPLIGNLRQMPSARAPLVFHDWCKKYGQTL
jgi:hypothetical protein